MSGRCERSVGACSDGGGSDEEDDGSSSDMASRDSMEWYEAMGRKDALRRRSVCHASHVASRSGQSVSSGRISSLPQSVSLHQELVTKSGRATSVPASSR